MSVVFQFQHSQKQHEKFHVQNSLLQIRLILDVYEILNDKTLIALACSYLQKQISEVESSHSGKNHEISIKLVMVL